MKVKVNNINRLSSAFERLIIKLQEVDDFCVEMTKDITHQDLSLIGYIGREDEVIMRQVAAFCEVPLSTATWTVDKLVDKKYLKRVNSREDRRIVKVSLTKKGVGVFDLFQSKKHELGERMLSNLPKERQDKFIETMEYIARNLQVPVDPVKIRN